MATRVVIFLSSNTFVADGATTRARKSRMPKQFRGRAERVYGGARLAIGSGGPDVLARVYRCLTAIGSMTHHTPGPPPLTAERPQAAGKEDSMNRSALVLAAALVFISSPLFAQRATKPPAQAAVVSTEVVNLNSATAAQIATLPGIGPKTADLVVQYRTKNGPFKKIEEIMNVRGVGEKSFLKIKDRLTVAAAQK